MQLRLKAEIEAIIVKGNKTTHKTITQEFGELIDLNDEDVEEVLTSVSGNINDRKGVNKGYIAYLNRICPNCKRHIIDLYDWCNEHEDWNIRWFLVPR